MTLDHRSTSRDIALHCARREGPEARAERLASVAAMAARMAEATACEIKEEPRKNEDHDA